MDINVDEIEWGEYLLNVSSKTEKQIDKYIFEELVPYVKKNGDLIELHGPCSSKKKGDFCEEKWHEFGEFNIDEETFTEQIGNNFEILLKGKFEILIRVYICSSCEQIFIDAVE